MRQRDPRVLGNRWGFDRLSMGWNGASLEVRLNTGAWRPSGFAKPDVLWVSRGPSMITNLSLIRRRRRPEYLASLLAFALAAGGMACRDTSPITGPTAPLPPLPSGSLVVRGTVIEHLEARKDGYTTASAPAIFGWDFETTDLLLAKTQR